MFITIVLLLVGLVILLAGAEGLVRGASSLSKKAGIPPIVIGLTIVAFGTSAPELLVNLFSAFSGTADLALGNIIGSNIANILLILGVSASLTELKVQRNTTWKEIPFAMLAVVVVLFMASDVLLDGAAINQLTRTDGLVLLGFFGIFLYYTVELFRKGSGDAAESEDITEYSYLVSIVLTVAGVFGLFMGGQLFVSQAIELATVLGVSDALIGLTVVAIGTSLPELATSLLAARKGQADLAIGNVVGSNIFNVFWILGLTSSITPLAVSDTVLYDILISVLVTGFLFVILFIGKKHHIQRWQGAVLLLSYVAYTVFLIIRG